MALGLLFSAMTNSPEKTMPLLLVESSAGAVPTPVPPAVSAALLAAVVLPAGGVCGV